MKISHNASFKDLTEKIKLLIKNSKQVSFNKHSLLDKSRHFLLKLCQQKIMGIGFSFLDILIFLKNRADEKNQTHRAKNLLLSLNYTGSYELDEKTKFCILCFLGEIQFEELEQQYLIHYQTSLNLAKNKIVTSDAIPNSELMKMEDVYQFMTPLTSALNADNLRMIDYIINKHPEWTETKYLLGQDAQHGGYIQYCINPYLIVAQRLNTESLRAVFKGEHALQFIEFIKFQMEREGLREPGFSKLKAVIYSADQIRCFNACSMLTGDGKHSHLELLQMASDLQIKFSYEDFVHMLNVVREYKFKPTYDFLFDAKDHILDQTAKYVFIRQISSNMQQFGDIQYLKQIFTSFTEDEIIAHKEDVIDAFQSLTKFNNNLEEAERFVQIYQKNVYRNIEALGSILEKYNNTLKKINALDLCLLAAKIFLKNDMTGFQAVVLQGFIQFATKNRDIDLLVHVINFALKKDCFLNAEDTKQILTTISAKQFFELIINSWKDPSNNMKKNMEMLGCVIQQIPGDEINKEIILTAIKYARWDFFFAIKQCGKKVIIDEQIVVELFAIDLFKNYYNSLPLIAHFVELFSPQLIEMKFKDNENIAHLIAKKHFGVHFDSYILKKFKIAYKDCYVNEPYNTYPSLSHLKNFINSNPQLLAQQNSKGQTPFHCAVIAENLLFLDFIDKSIGIDLEDSDGLSPLNIAHLNEKKSLEKILLALGAKDDPIQYMILSLYEKQIQEFEDLQENMTKNLGLAFLMIWPKQLLDLQAKHHYEVQQLLKTPQENTRLLQLEKEMQTIIHSQQVSAFEMQQFNQEIVKLQELILDPVIRERITQELREQIMSKEVSSASYAAQLEMIKLEKHEIEKRYQAQQQPKLQELQQADKIEFTQLIARQHQTLQWHIFLKMPHQQLQQEVDANQLEQAQVLTKQRQNQRLLLRQLLQSNIQPTPDLMQVDAGVIQNLAPVPIPAPAPAAVPAIPAVRRRVQADPQVVQLPAQAQQIPGVRLVDVPAPRNQEKKAFHQIPNNTHFKSVHATTATSIKALAQLYGVPDAVTVQEVFKEIKNYIMMRIQDLPRQESYFVKLHNFFAIQRYVNELNYQFGLHQANAEHYQSQIAKEEITNFPLFTILALIWMAANDTRLEVNFVANPLTEQDIEARRNNILDRMRRNIRGGNIAEQTGIDNMRADHVLCVSGQANNIVEALEGLHASVKIIRDPMAELSEEALKLAKNYFANYSKEAPKNLLIIMDRADADLTPNQISIKEQFYTDLRNYVNTALQDIVGKYPAGAIIAEKDFYAILDNLVYVDFHSVELNSTQEENETILGKRNREGKEEVPEDRAPAKSGLLAQQGLFKKTRTAYDRSPQHQPPQQAMEEEMDDSEFNALVEEIARNLDQADPEVNPDAQDRMEI